MKMRMKNALLLFVVCFGFWCVFPFAIRCLLLLFVALSCFFLKKQNRQILFVARYGFLLLVLVFCGCFHLSITLLVVAFCWYEKPKRAKKAKEVQIETRLQQNMAVKRVERDVQRVWLKAGQECFIEDVYSVSTTIFNGL